MFAFILFLVGSAVIGGSLGLLRWVGRGVRTLSRRTQLALATAAWAGETLLMAAVLLFVSGSIMPAEVLAAGLWNTAWVESAAALGSLGGLAALAWAWGVPRPAEVGLGWHGPGPRRAGRDTVFGLALGLAAVSVFPLAGLLGGWNQVGEAGPAPEIATSLLGGTVFFLAVAVLEEVSTRGCLFALLARWAGLPLAWALSLIVFTLPHGLNPGGSPMALVGVGLAGVVLAFAVLRTGALWVSMAFHLSWNWAQGLLYGYPVSGFDIRALLPMRTDPAAPAWATGGAFGPEASVFVVPALALAGVAIWRYTRDRSGPALLFPAGAPERSEVLRTEDRIEV
jgi:membrane protease YdiL (CAAX protease family)